jgi:uncharacterized protein YdaU (DUF1376 family)
MNYWPRWINAITNATAHLSLLEMGAYDRLLDHAYKTEAPLPADLDACCRIVRATTKADREAVRSVLAQFWKAEAGGFVNPRVTDEIEIARPKIEAAKANGAKGGRPRGTPEKPSGFPPGTQEEPAAKAPQSKDKEKDISKASPSHPPGGGLAAWFDEFWAAWPKGERKQDKARCLDHWRRHRLDATAAEILADVRVKRGTHKWQEGYIEAPLVYLRGKRWQDGVVPSETASGPPVTVPSDAAEKTAAYLAEQAEQARRAVPPPENIRALVRQAVRTV